MSDVSKRPGRQTAALRRRLQKDLGLTVAEARLAAALAQGMSLKDYAAAAGIAEGTARVQLKSVFARTGTHRQAELVALIWRRPRD